MIFAQLARNFGKLLVPDRHIADDHVRVDRNAHLADRLGGAGVHFFIIQRVQPVAEHLGEYILFLRLTIEQNIFGGRKAGNQGKLLMHHADAGMQRIKRRAEADLLAVKQDVAVIPTGIADDFHAEKDFHQRRFACAVFTDETEHFTCVQREVDVFENLVAEEILLDISHLQKWSVFIFHKALPT